MVSQNIFEKNILTKQNNQKKYCWEIYKNSECENCKYYIESNANPQNILKYKDIIIIE